MTNKNDKNEQQIEKPTMMRINELKIKLASAIQESELHPFILLSIFNDYTRELSLLLKQQEDYENKQYTDQLQSKEAN